MPSGSDKRQRTRQCLVRFTDAEFATLADRASKTGYTRSAFIRAAALGDAGPRAQRRVPADRDSLLRILGQCGKIGSNVNQIARQLNTGQQASLPELQEALRAYLDIRTAIFNALGLPPQATPDDHQRRQPPRP